jgi:hypothetical protein
MTKYPNKMMAWIQGLSLGRPLAATQPTDKLPSKPDLGDPNGLSLLETHHLRWGGETPAVSQTAGAVWTPKNKV